MTLEEFFSKYKNVAVAFSGGVDSAYLIYMAKRYAEKVCAYYVKTAFQPQFEYDDACKLAKELDVEMKVINLDILSNKVISSNPKNRCYYCKKEIFSNICLQAVKDGFEYVLDGTNASDDASDRPGMRALEELKVLSPLRMCGLEKSEIRRLSKLAGLFTHDKPAYACLATRIPSGIEITHEKLQRTENAENYLFSLGFSNFRVREYNGQAKLQIDTKQFDLLIKYRKEIFDELIKSYDGVLLDMEGRQ